MYSLPTNFPSTIEKSTKLIPYQHKLGTMFLERKSQAIVGIFKLIYSFQMIARELDFHFSLSSYSCSFWEICMKIKELKKLSWRIQPLENLYRCVSIIGEPCVYNVTKAKLDLMCIFCKDFSLQAVRFPCTSYHIWS